MLPVDARPGTPEHWLGRARGHLALAQASKPSAAYWEDLAFPAQQAAELAIKAVYPLHIAGFPFTHDLEELTDGLERLGISVLPEIRGVARLMRYAVETRYPGLSPPVTEQEDRGAVGVASVVFDRATALIARASNP